MLIFSYPYLFKYVLGARKNHLIETVLLSTHNIYFGREIRKLFLITPWVKVFRINPDFRILRLLV